MKCMSAQLDPLCSGSIIDLGLKTALARSGRGRAGRGPSPGHARGARLRNEPSIVVHRLGLPTWPCERRARVNAPPYATDRRAVLRHILGVRGRAWSRMGTPTPLCHRKLGAQVCMQPLVWGFRATVGSSYASCATHGPRPSTRAAEACSARASGVGTRVCAATFTIRSFPPLLRSLYQEKHLNIRKRPNSVHTTAGLLLCPPSKMSTVTRLPKRRCPRDRWSVRRPRCPLRLQIGR